MPAKDVGIKRRLQHRPQSDKLVSVTRCIVLYLLGTRSEVTLFSGSREGQIEYDIDYRTRANNTMSYTERT